MVRHALKLWPGTIAGLPVEEVKEHVQALQKAGVQFPLATNMLLLKHHAQPHFSCIEEAETSEELARKSIVRVLDVFKPWDENGNQAFDFEKPKLSAVGLAARSVADAIVYELFASNVAKWFGSARGTTANKLVLFCTELLEKWILPEHVEIDDAVADVYQKCRRASKVILFLEDAVVREGLTVNIIKDAKLVDEGAAHTDQDQTVFSVLGLALHEDTELNKALQGVVKASSILLLELFL
jgi:hypothetical protein